MTKVDYSTVKDDQVLDDMRKVRVARLAHRRESIEAASANMDRLDEIKREQASRALRRGWGGR